jgi:hypothetical protein
VARPLASGLPWTALYGLVGVLPLGLLVLAAALVFNLVKDPSRARLAG